MNSQLKQTSLQLCQTPWINSLYKFNPNANFYIVGGYVRDSLMNTESTDIDLLITGVDHANIIKQIQSHGKVVETSGHFKTIKFRPNNWSKELEDIDIVIPRIDIPMTNKEFKEAKKIDPSLNKHQAFKIESNPNMSHKIDLERRDITINSIAYNIKTNELSDPFNGVQDLHDKKIKMTNPLTFKEDPVRMLRCLRFAARYNFLIEDKTYDAIEENKKLIKTISVERILLEFQKTFKQAKKHLRPYSDYLNDLGLLKQIIPNYHKFKYMSFDFAFANGFAWFMYYLIGANQNSSQVYLESLKGDKETAIQLKAIQIGHDFVVKHDEDTMYQCNSKVYELYQITDKVAEYAWPNGFLNSTFKLFENNEYPKNVKELALNGNEIKELLNINDENLKIRGQEIGQAQELIIDLLLNDILKNNKKSLIYFLKNWWI